jgi:hypothetical protein
LAYDSKPTFAQVADVVENIAVSVLNPDDFKESINKFMELMNRKMELNC